MELNVPVPFEGGVDEAVANRQTHNFISFDGMNENCASCDCKPWHVAASYPCGASIPRQTIREAE